MVEGIKRMLAVLGIGAVLALSGLFAEAMVSPSVALAQAGSAPPVGRLDQKLDGVKQLMQRIGTIGVGIAVIVVGGKFLKGDPHAWQFAAYLVIGAAIIFGSTEMVDWLKN